MNIFRGREIVNRWLALVTPERAAAILARLGARNVGHLHPNHFSFVQQAVKRDLAMFQRASEYEQAAFDKANGRVEAMIADGIAQGVKAAVRKREEIAEFDRMAAQTERDMLKEAVDQAREAYSAAKVFAKAHDREAQYALYKDIEAAWKERLDAAKTAMKAERADNVERKAEAKRSLQLEIALLRAQFRLLNNNPRTCGTSKWRTAETDLHRAEDKLQRIDDDRRYQRRAAMEEYDRVRRAMWEEADSAKRLLKARRVKAEAKEEEARRAFEDALYALQTFDQARCDAV